MPDYVPSSNPVFTEAKSPRVWRVPRSSRCAGIGAVARYARRTTRPVKWRHDYAGIDSRKDTDMKLGAITNSWREHSLESESIESLVGQAAERWRTRGRCTLMLRQTCLGDCETNQLRDVGDDWRPNIDGLRALVAQYPALSFNLAVAYPCLSEEAQPKSALFQSMLDAAVAVSPDLRQPPIYCCRHKAREYEKCSGHSHNQRGYRYCEAGNNHSICTRRQVKCTSNGYSPDEATFVVRDARPSESLKPAPIRRDSDGRIPISEVCRLAKPTIDKWIDYWRNQGGTQAANDVAISNIADKLLEITGRSFDKAEVAVIVAECVEAE